ncbi:MAG: short-chain dehydrogenase [Hyphomicrobiales bacterium]|nr:MAG: short-chain dehydrogenase [Hyphomicrobiales bacterium]
MDLNDKVIIVTGAAQGLGEASARSFAARGAKVVLADIRQDAIEAHAKLLRDEGLRAIALPMDVTSSASIEATVARTLKKWQRIDGLMHSAMSAEYINNNDRRITELDEAVWDRVIDLVLTGTYRVVKAVGNVMKDQGKGSIVLTATVDAVIAQAGIDAYSAAKGGVVSLTRSAAAGLSPEGVRLNAICPSFITTPDQAEFLEVPEKRKVFDDMHLMDISTPEDIADYAAFLLSDQARIVTGAIHMVDSGYTCFKGKLALREGIYTN